MAYDSPSTINISEGIGGILQYINVVTDFWISRMIILAIGIMVFMGYYKSQPNPDFFGSLAVSSYVSFVLGLILFLLGFLDAVSMGMIVGITGISTLILLLEKRGQ